MNKKYEVQLSPQNITEVVEATCYQNCLDKIARKYGGGTHVRVLDIWVGEAKEEPGFTFGPHFKKSQRLRAKEYNRTKRKRTPEEIEASKEARRQQMRKGTFVSKHKHV